MIFVLAVDAFESVYARFIFLSLESKKVIFKVILTTLHYFFIVFEFVRSITFDVSKSMCTTYKSYMISFQQFLHYETPGFIFILQMVTM